MTKRKIQSDFDEEDALVSAEAAVIIAGVKSGRIETLPNSIVRDLIWGKNPVRVFRKYRELMIVGLAKKAGISPISLPQIEKGSEDVPFLTMMCIANALRISLDLLAPARGNFDQLTKGL